MKMPTRKSQAVHMAMPLHSGAERRSCGRAVVWETLRSSACWCANKNCYLTCSQNNWCYGKQFFSVTSIQNVLCSHNHIHEGVYYLG